MKLTQEHRALQDTVLRFVREEINPHVAAWEKAEEFPSHELFKKLGNLGLLGLKYPEEYGGAAPRVPHADDRRRLRRLPRRQRSRRRL
jgi:citronellyl-CoA dehydrogenase